MHRSARPLAVVAVVTASAATLLPFAAARAAGEDDPVRHAIEAVLDPASNHIRVRDAIELPADLRRPGAEFTLSPVLTIRESDPPVDRMPAKPGEEVRYALTAAPKGGILRVSYEGTFAFGLGDQKEEYTRGFRETKGIIGPEGVYLAGESGWVPEFGDRMIEFTVDVDVPAGWHVISQGNGTSRDDSGRARWDSAGRLEQIYLVGGPLLVERDSAGAVETLVYLHERDDALSRKYLDATARYIEMYRQLIGPYPYEKFALVENFWETGYGMPSFTLLGPQIIRFPFILTSSYPHEILHNWWGNSVFVDYMSGNWCEGLTAYLADHLIQEQRGLGAGYRRTALQKYRNYVNEGRDFPLSEFRSRHSAATEAVGYGKSLMAFHMLRCRVGDEAFRTALAGFYRKNRGRRASFDDLRVSFEAVTDDDLAPFFAQWVNRAGAPTLGLEDVRVRAAGGGHAVLGTLVQTQSGDPFDLEVPFVVRTAGGVETFVVPMRSRREGFELRLASEPAALSVDPMFDVFRVLDPRETPPSIGQLFGEPSILAVLPASGADEAEIDRYRELMDSWQADAHEIEVVLDTEIGRLPDGRAVWILGRGNRFAQPLAGSAVAGSVKAPGATLDLGGDMVALDDHCLVVIRRHPRSMEKAIGWLVVDPPAAFPGMSRKLPHYGKYSYLAFEGDEPTNIVKGQWPTTESPLVVDLREERRLPLAPISADPHAPLAELPPVFSRRSLMEHVEWLAAPEREGRGLGSAGLEASAAYIAEAFAEIGLVPGGDDGTWFQRFTVAEGPEGGPEEAVNVIGVLPGQNPDWDGQSVVLSAHYDHLGLGWPDVRSGHEGRIHFGADDNASGVAVMLEVARNLAEEGGGSRNLVLVAFSAEEAGRLGSRHYVEHPTYPLEQVRGVINLDTIGRLGDDPVAVHGTGTTDEWQHVFRGCSFVTGVPSKNVPGAYDGSDQASFIEKGVPAVQIFTGAHEDYHRSTDTVDKVDGAGLVKIATFLKEAVVYLLEREEPMTVRIDGAAATVAAPASGRSGRRVSFGTVPEFEYQGDGVKVASLVPGAPAARGGILAGDIIVRLGGTEIADLRAFSEFLKSLEPGQTVDVVVEREGAEVELTVVVEKR